MVNYCFQFQYVTKVLKRLEGNLQGGTQSSPKLLSLSLATMQASQKQMENRQAKLLLFRSLVIQISKLAGDQFFDPEKYTSLIPKMG